MNASEMVADLIDARQGARALNWPVSTPADVAAGYAAALAVRERRMADGDTPRGYKVGFTNRTIWPRYEVYAPIWGTVWDSGLVFADAGEQASRNTSRAPVLPAGTLMLDGLCEPRIEPEIIFCLRAPPPANCGLAELASCIAWLAHGYEIVHTHFPGWKFTAAQAVADGSLHGRLLVGPRVLVPSGSPAAALVDDLASLRIRLYANGNLKDDGVGANVLDGPLQALLYFVDELRALPGAPALQAGDLITTGTITDAHPVANGESWHSELEATGSLAGQLQGLRVTFG